MGDLAVDTQVEKRGDRFVATLSSDWEIWGPNGGYVSSIALRAAGAASRFRRPASFFVHYLGVAEFGEVELEVCVLKAAKRAESLRVSMRQRNQPILEALVWTVDALDGLQHDETQPPDVPAPATLKGIGELMTEKALAAGDPTPPKPPFKFWYNLESKPIQWIDPWPPPGPLPAVIHNWYRYTPTATFDDPFVDAARSLLLIDTMQWPAATRPHAHRPTGFVAPTIDLTVNFHRLAPEQEWLLCVAEAPVAHQGLIGGRAAIWTEDGRMLASGMGHLLCRPVPTGSPGAA